MNSQIGHNSAVRGTFADFKTVKTRGVCQLIIEVPIEAADNALSLLGGVPQAKAEQWVGIVPVTAPDAPQRPAETEAPKQEQPPKEKRQWEELSCREQAVLRCKQAEFCDWLEANLSYGHFWDQAMADMPETYNFEMLSAEIVKRICKVKSRSDLGNDNPKFEWARAMWRRIDLDYRTRSYGDTREGASR